MFSPMKRAISSPSCLGTPWTRMRSRCKYSARKQMETPRPTAVCADRVLSCSGIDNRALNALRLCTRFTRCFAGIIATRPISRHTRMTAFWFRSGVGTTPWLARKLRAFHQSGIFRAILLMVYPPRLHGIPNGSAGVYTRTTAGLESGATKSGDNQERALGTATLELL